MRKLNPADIPSPWQDISCASPSAVSIYKGMLFHFNPFYFIYPDQVTALTFDFIAIVYAVILDYTLFPAMEQFHLTDLDISEYLALAPGAPDGYHFSVCTGSIIPDYHIFQPW